MIAFALFVFVILAVAFARYFLYFYVKYDRIIDRRFKGQVFSNSAKIYAIPRVCIVGEKIEPREIAAHFDTPDIPKRRAIADGKLSPADHRHRDRARAQSPITAQNPRPFTSATGKSPALPAKAAAIWKPTNSSRR